MDDCGEGGSRWNRCKVPFNHQSYKNRLSLFGAAILDTAINYWKQKESGKKGLQPISNERFNEYVGRCTLDYDVYDSLQNIPRIPYCSGISQPQMKATKNTLNESNLVPGVADIPSTNMEGDKNSNVTHFSTIKDHLLIHPNIDEVNSIPPTLESLLLCPNKLNIKHLESDISSCRNLKSNHVDWEQMFDSQTLFTDQKNYKINIVAAKDINQMSKSEVLTKPKGNKVSERDTHKLAFQIEISKEVGLKKNYKQKKITELVPKKKLKPSEKFCTGISANGDSKSFRKKSSTTTVKKWLESISPEKNVNELGHDMDVEPSIVNKTSVLCSDRKTVQSRLVNQNGILKYTHTVNPSKFIISGRETPTSDGSSVCKSISIEASKANTEGAISLNNEKNASVTIESELMEALKQNLEKDDSALKRPSHVNIEYLSNKKNKNNLVGDDKVKNKKLKFVAPIKSQIPLKDIVYKIIHVDENTNYRNIDHLDSNNAVNLTLIYENEFSQLNCQHTEEDCVSIGILIGFNDEEFYYLSQTNIFEHRNVSRMLEKVLMSHTDKICFDAKAILIFAADCLRRHPNEISSRFLDVKVAGFLMDPDNPLQSFSEAQSAINYVPEFTVSTECHLQKAAWYMNILNDCMVKMKSILEERSLWTIFITMEMELLPILAGLEMRGLKVDTVGLDNLKGLIMEKMKTVEQECYTSAGKVFQINSPLQLRSIIYDDLKLDSKSNIKIKETLCSGVKSTSEAMLRSLADSHPLPKLVLEYRHLHKALATFVTGITHHVRDGVVRGNWLQTSAVTGRIACNNPNLQAIPKIPFQINLYPLDDNEVQQTLQLRSVYVARAGYALLAADFQHVECRVFAHLSQDGALLAALAGGGDLFRALAEKWLNKQPGDVSQEDRERTKRMVYASMYGAGTKKLMDILNMSYDQTLTVVSSFNRTFPSLKSFGQRLVERCRVGDGTLETLCGRRRTFRNIFSDNFALRSQAERQAVNFMIQGSAADLCKAAMIATDRSLRQATPPADCHLVLQIHDELVWEAARSELSAIRDLVKAAMESCGIACGMDIKLPVALSAGANWADMHPC